MPFTPRRFVIAFALTAMLMLVPAALVSLYLGPVGGDVSRVGHFAQRDFRAHVPQPPIERLPAPPLSAPADVLLLGDSFSQANFWQSELAHLTGKSVVTWHFKRVGCTGDWMERAMAGTLRAGAKTVIVQTVERELFKRFSDAPGCAKKFYPPFNVAVGVPQPTRSWDIFPMDIGYVAQMAIQYQQTRGVSGRYQSGGVVSVGLVRKDLFSNRLSDRLLYYGDDERKMEQWSEPAAVALLDRLAALRARAAAAGVQLHFLIIPDKSSVYWSHIRPEQRLPYPEQGEQVFALIDEKLGAEYNLLPYLRARAVEQVDLYVPGDSHFGSRGFRMLAERVAAWMQ